MSSYGSPQRRPSRDFDVVSLLVMATAGVAGFMVLAMLFSIPSFRDRQDADVLEAPASSAPVVEAEVPDPAGGGGVVLVDSAGDLSTLGWVVAAVVIAAMLGFVLRAVGQVGRGFLDAVMDLRHDRRQRKEDAAPGSATELRELQARHHELSVAYGSYLTDPLEVLRRPLLNDVTSPCTSDFVEAYAALNAIGIDGRPDNRALARYRGAVTSAWKAWRAADSEATRVGASNFSPEEQKRIRRAIDLLNLAADGATTSFEREQALKQAHKLIEGLVVLPKESALALHASNRLALEA